MIHIYPREDLSIEAREFSEAPWPYAFVVVDAYGEMIESNVPVGTPLWRRLARAARHWIGERQ